MRRLAVSDFLRIQKCFVQCTLTGLLGSDMTYIFDCSALQRDLEQEKRKAVELNEQVEEKTRQLSRLQTTFDRIKRRPLFSTPDMPMPMPGPLDTDVHGGTPFSMVNSRIIRVTRNHF